MANIVITGASRGIGLELARQYAAAGERVFALCRSPQSAPLLDELKQQSAGRLTSHQLDVTDPRSITQAADEVGNIAVDILINNAGILGGLHQSFDDIDFENWREAFEVMTIGPFRVVQAFVDKLAKSVQPKAITITSQVGASAWREGGLYAYASAKAASNRVVQVLAVDLKARNITVIAMHPGYVRTDMAGPGADISPQESAAGIRAVIAAIKPEDTGKFYRWNGEINPW